jgi:phosphoglycerol transferase MdoB-like AlkP superfamily enzyme
VGSILLGGLAFIGIRGGLQHKSINVQSAFVQGKNELGHLVLNSPYHFFRTLKSKRIEKVHYFSNDDEAKNIILNSRELKAGFEHPEKMNVVLLILESFSLEYVDNGFTPFLSSLKDQSLWLDKHLANGRRSIEVLPSVLCGLPSLINDPISKSAFSGNKFVCMPQLLKNAGYTNYFFHGGSRGTMGFETYTLSNGFQKYFSKEDYPGGDYDGTWGIYDEPFLKFSAKEISKMPEPFFAGIFTLSSHQPYAVPAKYKGKFKKGNLEIHESIGYTDLSVKEFFETIKNEPWFKNTIFVITADHTSKLESKKFQNMVGQYRVPLVIYSPVMKFPPLNKVTQHSDIPKTILDLVGVEGGDMPMVGASVFSKDSGLAINLADGRTYFMVTDDKVHTLDQAGNGNLLQIDWETGRLETVRPERNPELMANLQYFINGLINNNLSL